jgi:nucleoside-diphosphate-sugar epimerase
MAKKTVLVAGALGVIGRGAAEHLSTLPEWQVVGLSRRQPEGAVPWRHVSVDLLDPADCRSKLAGLGEVSHIVFAAYQEKADLVEQIAPNVGLLRNLVTTMESVSPALQHVTLFQGGKAYGCHLGPFKTPGKESDPRHMPPNFYYDQEDFLRAQSAGKRWSWTVLRPEAVCGFAVGNPMNLLMVIAVYAAISKKLGLPLAFPGPEGAYRALYQLTDARILAKAEVWAMTTPGCANEIFNITNGDYFRWSQMWPRFAAFFDMPLAPPLPLRLTQMMADKAGLWDRIVRDSGLQPFKYKDIASWQFGDFIFHSDYDNITSTIKCRKLGFHEVIDSEDMFAEYFAELRKRKVIP